MPDFSQWIEGQPPKFSANDHNAVMAMAKEFYAKYHSMKGGIGTSYKSNTIIDVYNDTGEDRGFGDAVAINDVYIPYDEDNSTNAEFFTRTTYTASEIDDKTDIFAVLCEPIPDGKVGQAVIMGVAITELSVQSEDDKTCGIDSGEYQLKTGTGSTKIIWKDKGTGDKWAAILIGVGSAVKTNLYQMIEDLDGETYYAKANPVKVYSSGFLYDPCGMSECDDTVTIIDPSMQNPCWTGDIVAAEPVTLSEWAGLDNTCQILNRLSSQLTFIGVLGETALTQGGSAGASLLINQECYKTVYDWLLADGQSIPFGKPIIATYFPDFRAFLCTGAPCQLVQNPS